MTYLLDDEGAGPTTTRSNVEATIQASAKSNVSSGDSVKLYYYINDHLGTPQRLVGENHQTVWEAEYSAFGQANISVELVKQNHRFPGQYFDQESELHYNWHRYYEPELGRYVTSDPIGLDGGLNTFGYVSGNPLKYADPLGLYESPWYLRSVVPGQGLFDQAMTSYENDNYGAAAGYAVGMLTEQVLTVLTFGQGQTALSGTGNGGHS